MAAAAAAAGLCVGNLVAVSAPARSISICRASGSCSRISLGSIGQSRLRLRASGLVPFRGRASRQVRDGCRRLPVALSAESEEDLEDDAEDGAVEVRLKVDGMTCGGCSGRVTEALKAMPSVTDAEVSHEKGIATVKLVAASYIEALEQLPSVLKAVRDLGFEAEAQL